MPPAASTRQQVLEYLVGTLLPRIQAGADYNFTLKTIERGWRSPDRMGNNEFPAVFIPTSHERRRTLTLGGASNGSSYEANPMEVILVLYVKDSKGSPGASGTGVQKDLDKLIADVTKAIEQDLFLGGVGVNSGLVTNVEITDVATDEGDKFPIAGAVVKVEYQYNAKGGVNP